MNLQRIAAYCQEIAARAGEAWGEICGNPQRAASARRARIVAIARQHREIAREASERQLREFKQRNRNWHF